MQGILTPARTTSLAALVAACACTAIVAEAEDTAPSPDLPPVLLQMSRDPAVWQELELSPSQISRMQQALDHVDGSWWRSRNLPSAERVARVTALTAELKQQIVALLDESQQRRLWQLERQALGTRMLLLNDVADTLHIDPVIRHRLADVARDTDRQAAELQQRAAAGEDPQILEKALQKLKDAERREVLKKLTAGQQQRISDLAGPAFDFSQIRRTLPRAPELVDDQGQWLQGDPALRRLRDLRGKVVVVHFFAFQCINCKRNLPHYAAWHRDFANRGLVVIGVQTPETSAERDPSKVAAAVEEEQIEYPVLLDTQSENWRNWGTTMWPSVYLIDRDGYIRGWWQGELNWQDTPGEQRMRRQIEGLLAEAESGQQ